LATFSKGQFSGALSFAGALSKDSSIIKLLKIFSTSRPSNGRIPPVRLKRKDILIFKFAKKNNTPPYKTQIL